MLAAAAAVGAFFLPQAVFLHDSQIKYAGSDYGRSRSAEAAYDNMFNTHPVIIFTADHGDGNGAHHWNQKTALYEEVACVPMIVCLPGGKNAGTVSDALINNGTDLMPREEPELETCFEALYGILLLKLQKKEIGEALSFG